MLLIALPERWSWGQDKKGMAGAPSAVGNVNISAIKKAVIAEKASYAENKIQDPFGFRGKNNLTPFLKQAFCLFIFFIILHCRMLWLLFFSTQSMRHVVIAIYFFDLRDIFFFLEREGSFGFSDGNKKNWDIVLFDSKWKYQRKEWIGIYTVYNNAPNCYWLLSRLHSQKSTQTHIAWKINT